MGGWLSLARTCFCECLPGHDQMVTLTGGPGSSWSLLHAPRRQQSTPDLIVDFGRPFCACRSKALTAPVPKSDWTLVASPSHTRGPGNLPTLNITHWVPRLCNGVLKRRAYKLACAEAGIFGRQDGG